MYSGTQYSSTGCSYSVMLIPFNHHVMLIPFGFLYKFVVPPTRILVVVPIVVLFLLEYVLSVLRFLVSPRLKRASWSTRVYSIQLLVYVLL